MVPVWRGAVLLWARSVALVPARLPVPVKRTPTKARAVRPARAFFMRAARAARYQVTPSKTLALPSNAQVKGSIMAGGSVKKLAAVSKANGATYGGLADLVAMVWLGLVTIK